jgi:hypothetical protein
MKGQEVATTRREAKKMLYSLNKDVETPSKGGSRMITIPWCQPVDESSNMEAEKQTKLTPHKSKTLFRLQQGVKMKENCGKDLDKKAAVIGSKVKLKLTKGCDRCSASTWRSL